MRRLSATLGISALLLAACGGESETVVEEAQEEGPAAAAAILGEPVTIQAEVQDFVTPRLFIVGDDTLVIGGEDLPIAIDDEVQVTGTVRELVVADVEEELGLDFDEEEEELLVDYERRLVVVADHIEILEL